MSEKEDLFWLLVTAIILTPIVLPIMMFIVAAPGIALMILFGV